MQAVFEKCSDAIAAADRNKSFGCFYSNRHDSNTNIHVHNCCEILFCLSGGNTFFIDGKIYNVEDGDVFIMSQYESHKITSDENKVFERYVMQLNPSFLHHYSTAETDLSKCFYIRNNDISHKISTDDNKKAKLKGLFDRLKENHEFGDDVFKAMLAVEIVTNVNEWFLSSNEGYTYDESYGNKNLVAILKFINENISYQLSLDIISKHTYISQNEICRLFKKYMGTTVKQYIISRQITEAKKLLRKGASVSETAEKCGFGDYSNFIRAFTKIVGISPGKFKKI